MPGSAGIVGEIDAAGGFRCVSSGTSTANGTGDGSAEVVNHGVEAIRVAGRDRDADLTDKIVDGKAAGELVPGVTAICRFVEAAARHVRRSIDRPWRTACGPERRVDRLRVLRVECEIDRPHVFGIFRVGENLFPRLAA